MHTHTHTHTNEVHTKLKKTCTYRRVYLITHTHTHTHMDHLQWSICLFVGGISSLSVIKGSCGLRKILSVHHSKGEKSNQIKSFVSPKNNSRSNTQQSLTPMAHTIAKEITPWEKRGGKKRRLNKIFPYNVRQHRSMSDEERFHSLTFLHSLPGPSSFIIASLIQNSQTFHLHSESLDSLTLIAAEGICCCILACVG